MHTNFKTSNKIELRRRMMSWKVFFFVILTKLNFPKSSYEEEEYENQLKDFLLRNKLNLVLVTDPWYPHVCIVWVMFLESVLVDGRGNHFPGVRTLEVFRWVWRKLTDFLFFDHPYFFKMTLMILIPFTLWKHVSSSVPVR